VGISYFGDARYVNLDKILELAFTEHYFFSTEFKIIIADKSANISPQLQLLPYSRHIKAWHDGREISPDECRKILFNI
jgi:hypothetical protein